MTKNRIVPTVLDLEEIKALKNAPNERYISGLRDKAIIWLTLNTGLRVTEIINLKRGDINLKSKCISLKKAKKDSFGNVIWDSPEVGRLLKSWLSVRPDSEWLFCTITKNRNIAGKGITKPGGKPVSYTHLTLPTILLV